MATKRWARWTDVSLKVQATMTLPNTVKFIRPRGVLNIVWVLFVLVVVSWWICL